MKRIAAVLAIICVALCCYSHGAYAQTSTIDPKYHKYAQMEVVAKEFTRYFANHEASRGSECEVWWLSGKPEDIQGDDKAVRSFHELLMDKLGRLSATPALSDLTRKIAGHFQDFNYMIIKGHTPEGNFRLAGPLDYDKSMPSIIFIPRHVKDHPLKRTTHGKIVAQYNTKSKVIFVRPIKQHPNIIIAILIHEITHAFQDKDGTLESRLEIDGGEAGIEAEAYFVQDQVLNLHSRGRLFPAIDKLVADHPSGNYVGLLAQVTHDDYLALDTLLGCQEVSMEESDFLRETYIRLLELSRRLGPRKLGKPSNWETRRAVYREGMDDYGPLYTATLNALTKDGVTKKTFIEEMATLKGKINHECD